MNSQRYADGVNNFDLIRLLAAVEVALVHAIVTLGLGDDPAMLHLLPGVPIFFLISGFLIFPSFSASHDLRHYVRKRSFRIFPALYVCFAICVVVLMLIGQFAGVAPAQALIWAVAQLTIAQFYNPDFLRDFGTGALNGSLWTISVELQFYLLTPVLAWLVKRWPWLWMPMIGLFALCNVAFTMLAEDSTISKLAMVTFLPWLYMFLVGAWLSTRADLTAAIRKVPPLWFAAAFLLSAVITGVAGLPVGTNSINPIMFAAMAGFILRLAFAMPSLSRRLLGGVDISYGLYIYHMPVFNLLLWAGLGGSLLAGALGFAIAIGLATASWFLVERPALSFARRS